MLIYLLTFCLFDDVEKNIKITHANHSATSKAIWTKMLVQPERLYFLFAFCARNYPWWSLWQKNTQNNCFIQVKSHFSVVEVGNAVFFFKKCSFWRHINVSYNNRTWFPLQIVLLWVTCWHRSIKTLKHLIIDTSYSLGSSDVITNVNTLAPINPFIFLQKLTADTWLFKMKL